MATSTSTSTVSYSSSSSSPSVSPYAYTVDEFTPTPKRLNKMDRAIQDAVNELRGL